MKKYMGYFVLSLPFIATFVVGYNLIGFRSLLLCITIVLSIIVCIAIGGSLIGDDDEK